MSKSVKERSRLSPGHEEQSIQKTSSIQPWISDPNKVCEALTIDSVDIPMHTYAQKMADFRTAIANRAAIGNQVQAPTLPAAADTGTPRYPQRQRSKPSKKAQSSPITCQPETRTQSPERAPDDGAWVEVTGVFTVVPKDTSTLQRHTLQQLFLKAS